MAFSINTNVAALNAHKAMVSNDMKLSNSLNRLSTGLRINKAADDASGMKIADSLRAQHLGIGQAVKNANDAISMVQTADGALEESINIVNTIKTKAIQAASDSQTTDTRKAIQADIDKLMEELDVIAQTTSYNGQKLLSGVFTNKEIQIGAYANETASINIGSTESTKVGHISTSQLSLQNDGGGETQLTITSSITGAQYTLNSIDIQANNQAENGMGALADEINRYTSETGISATAIVESTTGTAIQEGTTDSSFAINGITIGEIEVSANDSTGSLVSAINDKVTEHGVTASMNSDGTMTLTSSDGRAIEVTGSVSDVMGKTAGQMSTLGYLNLTQAGTSTFQIEGIGAGATGIDFTVSGSMTTVEASILESGSTIGTGSVLTAGTVIGGNVLMDGSSGATALDFELTAGTQLTTGTVIDEGSVMGGSFTVISSAASTSDSLLSAGSTLASGTILKAGTVITTEFTNNSVTYEVGDVLSDDVTISNQDITLQADMTLETGSALGSGSILAVGTQMGVDVTSTGTTILSTDMTLQAGSGLGSGSTLAAGTTLGDSVTVDGDVATSLDTTLAIGSTLQTGSVLAEGSTIGGSVTVSEETLDNDMTLKAGTVLGTATVIEAGTVVGQDFTNNGVDYKAGDVLTDDVDLVGAQLTLSEDWTFKEGSVIGTGSTLAVNTTNAGTVGLDNTETMRLADINVLTQEGAQFAISIADAALADLDSQRSDLGSVQNQLTSTIANLSTTKTNIMASESTIRDVDFAEEASTYSNLSLLAQTSSYALAQSNASTQNLLSLLQ
ncbi:MAG: flagellar protein FlaB [Desulfobacterales bacterium]|nr:flagellar protein FlaB [Desulfobacterales bacterium]